MTTHWMSPIERSNPRVMAGKATLTYVSSCTAPVPSPITATCQDLVFKQAANELISSCLESEGTSQCSWCDFCPATKIHRKTRRRARMPKGIFGIPRAGKERWPVTQSLAPRPIFAVHQLTPGQGCLIVQDAASPSQRHYS